MPPPKTEKQLSAQARSNFLKAISALEMKNYQYGVTLLQDVLREEPSFIDGRKVLRRAQVGQIKEKKGFFGGLKGGSPLAAMKAQSVLRKDPAAGMDAAEKLLEGDPYNAAANQVLKDGALALDLY